MRRGAKAELDRVDAMLPGEGMLEAYMFGSGTLDGGQVGGALDYSHRVSERVSAFAHGELGHSWGNASGLNWKALVGLRGRF